ncbi:hypothetical protein ACFQY4_02655 [Catellatospora bangladeshensis]|uniref:hypothetical protein n=1 Tax=Catellatospora bangladeshensis TaxID=310355 RepID=UPI00360E9910
MSSLLFGDELVTSEVAAARRALVDGLSLLRTSLNEMLATAVRGDGGTQRIRTRQGNDAAVRHQPPAPSRSAAGSTAPAAACPPR